MTSFVTETSNLPLWTILAGLWTPGMGWVIHDGVHFKAAEEDDGSLAFIGHSNQELYDSRSFGSKEAQYSKLDDG